MWPECGATGCGAGSSSVPLRRVVPVERWGEREVRKWEAVIVGKESCQGGEPRNGVSPWGGGGVKA